MYTPGKVNFQPRYTTCVLAASRFTVITTNSTLMGDSLQSQLKYFPEKTLIIGDEAHNLGAPRLEQSLPRAIGLRLALSATPERYLINKAQNLSSITSVLYCNQTYSSRCNSTRGASPLSLLSDSSRLDRIRSICIRPVKYQDRLGTCL